MSYNYNPETDKITIQMVIDERTAQFKKSMAIIEKKGRDYNRKQQDAGDTLFNLRVSTILGITTTPQQGVMVRLSDKFMRLCSLFDAAEQPANTDESFEDSVRDFHNYLDYMVLFRREQQRKLAAKNSFVQTYVDEAKKAELEGSGVRGEPQ